MSHRFAPTTFFIWSGLLIWAADFLFVYVFSALACARRFADVNVAGMHIVPLATTLASLVALAGTVAVMRAALKRARSDSSSDEPAALIRFLSLALAGLALVAIIWIAVPPLVLRDYC